MSNQFLADVEQGTSHFFILWCQTRCTEVAIVVILSTDSRQLGCSSTINGCASSLLLKNIFEKQKTLSELKVHYQWFGEWSHDSKQKSIEPPVSWQWRRHHITGMQRVHTNSSILPTLIDGVNDIKSTCLIGKKKIFYSLSPVPERTKRYKVSHCCRPSCSSISAVMALEVVRSVALLVNWKIWKSKFHQSLLTTRSTNFISSKPMRFRGHNNHSWRIIQKIFQRFDHIEVGQVAYLECCFDIVFGQWIGKCKYCRIQYEHIDVANGNSDFHQTNQR